MVSATHLCDSSNSTLLIIDIQSRLGGSMPNKVLSRVVENTVFLLKSASLLKVPVIASEQYPKGLGEYVHDISNNLPSSTHFIQKTCFSCCGSEDFISLLEKSGRKQVILTGMEAHVCVLQTAVDLYERGFDVFVVGDSICSRRLDNYQNALDRMAQLGCHLLSTESVVFEWLRDAKNEHFKEIAALLR